MLDTRFGSSQPDDAWHANADTYLGTLVRETKMTQKGVSSHDLSLVAALHSRNCLKLEAPRPEKDWIQGEQVI